MAMAEMCTILPNDSQLYMGKYKAHSYMNMLQEQGG